MRIALIGARGFVGGALATALRMHRTIELVEVTRDSYSQAQLGGSYDLLINAAMPSRRFWAKSNPPADFQATVALTFQLLNDWKWRKFVQISSVSARCQCSAVYGRHKRAAEDLCDDGSNLICRLGPLYGRGLDKGVLIDMLQHRTVYADARSRYAFTSVEWAAQQIAANLERSGVVEIGACDAVPLGEVAKAIDSRSDFQGAVDHQGIEPAWPAAPSAWEVLDYLKECPKP